MRRHAFDLRSTDLTPESLAAAYCVVIATDHDDFDFEAIRTHSKLVVDTRGRYRGEFANVVRS